MICYTATDFRLSAKSKIINNKGHMKINAGIIILVTFLHITTVSGNITVENADTIWNSSVNLVSDDVINSSDAPPQNVSLIYLKDVDTIWNTSIIPASEDIINPDEAQPQNITTIFVKDVDTVWKQDLIQSTDLIPPNTNIIMNETSSTTETLFETVISQSSSLNTSITGDLSGSLNFTSLETVLINSGSFAGEGFSKGGWSATIEGVSYDGNWQGVLFEKPDERRIYIKGTVAGGLKGIVEGYLTESVNGSGIYDQYYATWTISQMGIYTVYSKIDVNGTINYGTKNEYSSELYALQTFIEGKASGHYNGSLSVVLTHVRIDNVTNPYYGQGFSIISYVSEYGSGEGWTYDSVNSPGIVGMKGLFVEPLMGIASGVLDESGGSRVLSISIERIDIGSPPMAYLYVKIWGPERISPGQTVQYIIEYRNTGLMALENAEIRVELPEEMEYKYSSENSTYDSLTHSVTLDLEKINAKSNDFSFVTVYIPWGLSPHTFLKVKSIAYMGAPSASQMDGNVFNIGDSVITTDQTYVFDQLYGNLIWIINPGHSGKIFGETANNMFYVYYDIGVSGWSFHDTLKPYFCGNSPVLMSDVADYAKNAQFDEYSQATMVAVAWDESDQGNKLACNKKGNAFPSWDRGILQINSAVWENAADTIVFDPYSAFKWSHDNIYSTPRGINHWDSYEHGGYKNKLKSARDIVNPARINWDIRKSINNIDTDSIDFGTFDINGDSRPGSIDLTSIVDLRITDVPIEFDANINDITITGDIKQFIDKNTISFSQNPINIGEKSTLSVTANVLPDTPPNLYQGKLTFNYDLDSGKEPRINIPVSIDLVLNIPSCSAPNGQTNTYNVDCTPTPTPTPTTTPTPTPTTTPTPTPTTTPTPTPIQTQISESEFDSEIIVAGDPNIKYGPDGFILPDQRLNYTVEFENEGEGIAFGVYLTDILDEDLDDSTLDIGPVLSKKNGSIIAPPGTYNPSTRTITWFVGEVGSKEGGYANYSINARSDAEEGTEIINFATVYFPSVPETTRTNGIVSIIDVTPPRYSNAGQDESVVIAGEAAEVYAYWQDGVRLNHTWLKTNESGIWQNVSYLEHSGYKSWSNFTIQTTKEGEVCWKIHANDTAGNENVTPVLCFNVLPDTTPPQSISNLSLAAAGTTWLNFTWDNPPDIDFSHAVFYLNGTFITNISAPQNFYNITELTPDTLYGLGTHTVDISDNTNETWKNATARTLAAPDIVPPLISITSPLGIVYTTSTIPLIFTIEDTSSIEWINYSLDGAENVTVSGSTLLTDLADSAHIIVIYAKDSAGNIGSASVDFTVNAAQRDTIPPAIESITLYPSNATSGARINISISASDNIGVVEVTANGTLLANVGGLWNGGITAASSAGTYTITIRANDSAGNSAERAASYKVVAPTGSLGVGVAPKTTTASISGATIDYTVKIKSLQNFDDIVRVNVTMDGLSASYQMPLEWFSWNNQTVRVASNSTISLPLRLTIPLGQQAGRKAFKVRANSTFWMTTAYDSGVITIS